MKPEQTRCQWCGDDPLYVQYHDDEWGEPVRERDALFECLCLEGQQAGLSWITVLRKREGYRRGFHGFAVEQVAAMQSEDIERLVLDPGVIRHRGKLEAIVGNAKAVLAMESAGEDFAAFVWDFAPPPTAPGGEFPSQTSESVALSKALKKRGFRFVGPTTVYAFMQAVGMVDDHAPDCFKRGVSASR